MKVIAIIVVLAIYVCHTKSDKNTCRGAAIGSVCEGLKNRGVSGWVLCRQNANADMWYYDTKSRNCKKLDYKGCGGNKNRFCSRVSCLKQCKRSIDNKDKIENMQRTPLRISDLP